MPYVVTEKQHENVYIIHGKVEIKIEKKERAKTRLYIPSLVHTQKGNNIYTNYE